MIWFPLNPPIHNWSPRFTLARWRRRVAEAREACQGFFQRFLARWRISLSQDMNSIICSPGSHYGKATESSTVAGAQVLMLLLMLMLMLRMPRTCQLSVCFPWGFHGRTAQPVKTPRHTLLELGSRCGPEQAPLCLPPLESGRIPVCKAVGWPGLDWSCCRRTMKRSGILRNRGTRPSTQRNGTYPGWPVVRLWIEMNSWSGTGHGQIVSDCLCFCLWTGIWIDEKCGLTSLFRG